MRMTGQTTVATALMFTCALASLAITPSRASAQDTAAHRIAVVDVAYIFKNHPGIKAQVSKIEGDLKDYEIKLKAEGAELKTAAEQLKTFKVGTPGYAAAEEKVASLESKLRLNMARKRKELKDAEGQIYFENYQRIAEGVKVLAQHYKINLVLRYNSESMDMENGESVLRGLMKNIVYHDNSLDMTKGVMQYLDKFNTEVAGRPSSNR